MGRRVPRSFAPMPPAAELKATSQLVKRKATHEELVAVMRTLLRPAEGVFTRWSTLRRMLALAGHRTALTHVIARAMFEVVPDAWLGRMPPRGRGPRGVCGVSLKCDLQAMREALTQRWERAVGIPPEVELTPMKFKLEPANDNGYANTLATMVTRVHLRKQDATAYYGMACEYLHRAGMWPHFPGDKAIWALHCEGATRQEIARELGLNENKVQSVIDFHRSRSGLVHR
jgi:hypothetical protein